LAADQVTIDVVEILADMMTHTAHAVVVLPTLGLTFEPLVFHLVILASVGIRKGCFSVAVVQYTPDHAKLLYVDPTLLEQIREERVLTGHAVSSGQTRLSALTLQNLCGAEVAGLLLQ
jgi:hypothetical protein